ncbi:MAG: hypothetical protein HKN12_01415, partial [Gemmatimonadetes bacterium]|nr:hypothetical protein [Gemmatimonadota bacterium]
MPFAIMALLLAAAASGAAPPAVARPQLTPPSGNHTVGTRTFDWTDRSREEPATADPDDHRTLVIQVWYPGAAGDDGSGAAPPAPYMPRLDAYRQTTDEALIESLRAVRTNSFLDLAMAEGSFPVVLFSHGWGGSRSWYSLVLEHVASHGYVVVGTDHPYMGEVAMPDGSVILPDDSCFANGREASDWYSSDLMFVIDRLAEARAAGDSWAAGMNLEQIVTMGHSSGGSAA